MDEDAIREVVEGGKSLYERPPHRGRGWSWTVVATVLGVVAVAVVVVVVLVRPSGVPGVPGVGEPNGGSSTLDRTTPNRTTPSGDPAEGEGLVAYDVEPRILYYPTILPAGMELCEAQTGLPVSGDEFCDPDDPGRWIRVATTQGGVEWEPVEGHDNLFVVQVAPPKVDVAFNGFGLFSVSAEGVTLEDLIVVAASMPFADPGLFDSWLVDPVDDDVVVLDEAALVSLIARPDLDIHPDAAGGWTVYGRDEALYTGIGARLAVWQAAGLAKPRVVDPSVGLVVGAQPFSSSGAPGARAMWQQGGRVWDFEAEGSIEAMVDRALAMVAAIRSLPREVVEAGDPPSLRTAPVLVSTGREGSMMLFGGLGFDGPEGDTWTLDVPTAVWTEVSTEDGPSARVGHTMVYVPPLDAVLLFGGTDHEVVCNDDGCHYGLLGDTWLWDVATSEWREVTAAGPPPRTDARMAWDPDRSAVVLFGGDEILEGTSFPVSGADTWTFDVGNLTWSELSASESPGPASGSGMVYDTVNRRVLLFGGAELGQLPSTIEGELWALGSTDDAWIRVNVSDEPAARVGHAFVWDEAGGRAILLGGVGRRKVPISGGFRSELGQFPDVWAYDVSTDAWAMLDPEGGGGWIFRGVAIDGASGLIVAFGGEQFGGQIEPGTGLPGRDVDVFSLIDNQWR